ncbi:MAG: MFS transporter [Armatimonadota bacterium]|nr:MFS transporter [Armatimonadota bacterium]
MRAAFALTAFYFASFAALGVFLPYFNLYLLHLGFTPWQIGVIAAMPPLLKILVPAVFGLAADRTGHGRLLIIGTSAGATASFALLLTVDDFVGVLVAMIVFSLAWAPVLPLVEATTLEMLDRIKRFDYGRIRLWGSVGFIVATLWMGAWLKSASSDRVILYGVLAGYAMATLAAYAIPRVRLSSLPQPVATSSLAGLRPLWLFYAACLLMQFSHGTYYGFFSIALEARGWSTSAIGALWTAGVVAEVAFMLWSGRVMASLGAGRLFAVSFAAAVARWTLLSVATSASGLVAAQGLHALTFGAFHVAAVTLVHRTAPPSLRSTGQTLYSSLAYGVGSAGGSLLNGALYARWGASALFAVSAVAAAGGLILALRFLAVVDDHRSTPAP